MLRFAQLTTVLTLIWLTVPTWAIETKSYNPSAYLSAKQWDVLDIAFKASSGSVRTEFSAEFQHEKSGEQFEVHGFFNGSGKYVLRFTPPTAGNWKFTTTSFNQDEAS
ncbi:MAG: DUF5060 domain-containing protein, partial [Planctomycetota bacterium]